MKESVSARIQLVLSVFIFGSIGIFVKYVSMPSSVIACARGLIGTVFLLFVLLVSRQKLSFSAIKKNLLILLFSGAAIGFNWILLFEAYNYTSVATATLSYYFAPFFVMLASPFLLREKLSAKKVICILVAMAGMIPVSGVLDNEGMNKNDITGILLGLSAAVLYASVIIMNKKLRDITAYERTVMQLFSAAVVVIPYILLTEDVTAIDFSPRAIIMLVILGIVHTGIAYAMYFNSMKTLNAQTVAIFSYIDPAVAILFSAFLLKEGMSVPGIIGAVMILGSSLISELSFGKNRKKLKKSEK